MNSRIAQQIAAERSRQDARHPYDVPDSVMLSVLVEEVGEVARAMNDNTPDDLAEEVMQCAAVAVKWMELLDARIRQAS